MTEYLKFWLAREFISIVAGVIVVAALFLYALWSLRGQKFYQESKTEKAERKSRNDLDLHL